MTYVKLLIFSLTFFYTTNIISQVKNEPWKILSTYYIHSYGDKCTIVVLEDHSLIRDVIMIQPSIEYLFNKQLSNENIGNRITCSFSIGKGSANVLVIDNIRIRFNDTIYNHLNDSINLIAKDFEIELLKSDSTAKNGYMFGFYMYKN